MPGKRLVLIAVLWASTLLPHRAAAASPEAGFLYPEGKVSVQAESLRLIGRPAGGQAVLRLTSAGKTITLKVPAPDGIFARRIRLGVGPNRVELLDDAGRSLDSVEIRRLEPGRSKPEDGEAPLFRLHPKDDHAGRCESCHEKPEPDGGYPARAEAASCITAECHTEYPSAPFPHGPIQQGNCTGCHDPHGTTKPFFLKALRSDLCFSCHEELPAEFARRVVHAPVAEGDCLACHDPHGSDLDFHLKRHTIRELCAGCHGDDVSRHKVLHGPVASGGCTTCHNPHVSDHPGLLFEKGNELCLTCHAVRRSEFEREHVHKPVRKDCTTCHDPHGTDFPFHLRPTPGKDPGRPGEPFMTRFCLSCHREKDPELVRAVETAPVPHEPVRRGECLECHTPHSTNFRRQLKKSPRELCFSCHEEMARHITESRIQHGPVAKGCCPDCHQVHGGVNRKLLADRFERVPARRFEPERVALCFNCHERRVFTDEKNTETGFRDGNRNLHYWHVNRTIIRSCDICHDIHASNQDRHMRSVAVFKDRYRFTIDYTATPDGGTCVTNCHRPARHRYQRNTGREAGNPSRGGTP